MTDVTEIIKKMEAELKEVQSDKTNKMQDIDSNTAFELGFESAIHTLKNIVNPTQLEIGLIVFETPEQKEITE